ncbi:ABC transporter permease [Demequina zhanjiangensis]|uniref:ABC transporter permease n=1 Tax=Demequina zhanjiangensis TaxID=3051659 RepID=A0ABT8G113_9MICO|nr:ABC transporter permease [Demequina sp. SYSU T00b26]MDN4472821.1 ABC transporter permease [Demequina sp. SYSU T00b26]
MTTTLEAPQTEQPDADVASGPSWKIPILLGVVGLIAFILFGLGTPSGTHTTFVVSRGSDAIQIPSWAVPAQAFALFLTISALLLAGVSAWGVATRRKLGSWVPILFGLAIIASILVWAGAGKTATSIQVTGLLIGTVVLATPLVFGALAGMVCERSGVVNIAIEGQLLSGAFMAALVAGAVAGATGSSTVGAYAGLLAAPLAGALLGAMLALFAVRYWVDQIVVGVVLNVLAVGLTNFFFGTVMRENPDLNRAIGLPDITIPLLSDIPVVGPVFFDQNLLVYAMYALVIIFNVMLFKSRWGLRVRAVGEHPKAADTVGIKVNRTRVRNTILGGAIAGLGGAFFTVASGLAFNKEMTGGKGYIALAAMILGRWSPKGALAAAMLFGFADSLREQFGIIGTSIPSQFLAMLPYLATIFAVAGLVGHVRPPAAENIPYKK